MPHLAVYDGKKKESIIMKTRRFLRPFSALVFTLVLACSAFASAACDNLVPKDTDTDADADTFYKVTLDFDATLGSVTASAPADPKGYAPDEQVTVTFAPNTGYAVSSVKVNDADVTVSGDSYSFAVKGDTTVKVGFGVAHYQVTVTSPAAAEGTLSVSAPASESGYVLGEKVTVTVEANAGYYVTAVKVNGTAIEAVEGEYSFTVAGATTVSAEFGAFADALSGKTYYSFAAAYGYTFQSGKATALSTGAEAIDYAFTSDNTAVLKAEEDTALVVNDDGTLLVGDDTYFVVGEELTVSVKESGTDVDVVFTIEKVDVSDDGSGLGDSYTVFFGSTCTYGAESCVSIDNYADELTLVYVKGTSSYTVTVDLTDHTASKALSGVSLLTADGNYRLDISTKGANRFADFFKKDGSSFKQVGSSLARKSREVDDGEFEYYWEANETAGDVTTVYTIVITGAKWRDPAALDDYSDAKITVTKVDSVSKTLTATGTDGASYEVTFAVEGDDITITVIKKDGSRLYDPKYFAHQTAEILEPNGEKSFKYSYTKTVYGADGSSKDHSYELTITLTGDSSDTWVLSVDAKDTTPQDLPSNLKTKTIWPRVTAPNGDGYEGITVQYDDNNKVWGITGSFDCYISGGGYESVTVKSSTAQDQGNSTYLVTAETTRGQIKLQIVVSGGPNFTITVVE